MFNKWRPLTPDRFSKRQHRRHFNSILFRIVHPYSTVYRTDAKSRANVESWTRNWRIGLLMFQFLNLELFKKLESSSNSIRSFRVQKRERKVKWLLKMRHEAHLLRQLQWAREKKPEEVLATVASKLTTPRHRQELGVGPLVLPSWCKPREVLMKLLDSLFSLAHTITPCFINDASEKCSVDEGGLTWDKECGAAALRWQRKW